MRMRENLMDIYKVLINDETLLRLLYYKPSNMNDDPLSLDKPNILDKPDLDKWNIINDLIVPSVKVTDLDETEKCRVLIFPADRNSAKQNYYFSDQRIIVDVLTHVAFDSVDFRNSWICDRINDLLFNEHVTGIGKMNFIGGKAINAPNNYVGYRLMYEFYSLQ